MKKVFAMILLAAMVLTAFGGCTRGGTKGGGNDSCEEAVERYMKMSLGQLTRADAKKMQPTEFWTYMEKEGRSFDELYEEAEEQCQESKERLEDIFGKGYKLSVEVTDEEKLDEDGLEEARQRLEAEWFKPEKLTAGYEMEWEVTISGQEDAETYEGTGIAIKYAGDWYILEMESSDLDELFYE